MSLIKLEHQSDDFDDVLRVPLSEDSESLVDHDFAIVTRILLVEAGNVLHQRKLHHDQTTTEDITLEDVVSCMPLIATFLDVGAPQDWR